MAARSHARSIVHPAGESGVSVHSSNEATSLVRSLTILLPALYAINFAMAAVLSAVFGVTFNWLGVFEHNNFSPAGSGPAVVNWLSFVLTFAAAGPWLIVFLVRDAQRAVDGATAVTMTHFFICTIFTQRMPENWQWWASVMPSWVFAGRFAEFLLSNLGERLLKPLRSLSSS